MILIKLFEGLELIADEVAYSVQEPEIMQLRQRPSGLVIKEIAISEPIVTLEVRLSNDSILKLVEFAKSLDTLNKIVGKPVPEPVVIKPGTKRLIDLT